MSVSNELTDSIKPSKGRRLKLRPHSDFIQRLSKAPALQAFEELVWNCFDESARNVEVILVNDDLGLGGIKEIRIEDDGDSLSFERAPAAFENLGNSAKANRRLESGARLHGRKGEGRHKAFSLGSEVEWLFTYQKNNRFYQYKVVGSANREDPFFLIDEYLAPSNSKVGCCVTISKIDKDILSITGQHARSEITSRFAPFLLRHQDRTLMFSGKKINPRAAIAEHRKLAPLSVDHDGIEQTIKIEVIFWKSNQGRQFFLCSSSGIPLHPVSTRALTASENFTVFASSEIFDSLHEQNLLSGIELSADNERQSVVASIRKRVRKYFRRRLRSEADEALQRLRDEGSYPYGDHETSELVRVERKVFDICTVNISRHLPNFSEGMDTEARKLLLRVIKEAITQNPSGVGKIIREVCRLPNDEADAFAQLLEYIPLKNVIHLSRCVSERLVFLDFFESIVYLDPFESKILERSQLHKILAANTWIFGEEYAIGTNDTNISSILEKHVHILGRDHLSPDIRDEDIKIAIREYSKTKTKTDESLSRIPDLVLWKKFIERRPDEYEFLVIELKRPGVKIGRDQIAQIEDYSKAVSSSPFTDSERTRWTFVVVSDELDEYGEMRTNQQGLPKFTIQMTAGSNFEIRAYPWMHLIRSARSRHEHLKNWLSLSLSSDQVAKLADDTYSKFLPARKSPQV